MPPISSNCPAASIRKVSASAKGQSLLYTFEGGTDGFANNGGGITVTQDRRNIWDWQKVVDARDFDIALDFSGDFYDDPTLQLTKYVSHDLSPVNFAGSTDRFLDALYVAQAMTTDPRQRAKMVHDFERHALRGGKRWIGLPRRRAVGQAAGYIVLRDRDDAGAPDSRSGGTSEQPILSAVQSHLPRLEAVKHRSFLSQSRALHSSAVKHGAVALSQQVASRAL